MLFSGILCISATRNALAVGVMDPQRQTIDTTRTVPDLSVA